MKVVDFGIAHVEGAGRRRASRGTVRSSARRPTWRRNSSSDSGRRPGRHLRRRRAPRRDGDRRSSASSVGDTRAHLSRLHRRAVRAAQPDGAVCLRARSPAGARRRRGDVRVEPAATGNGQPDGAVIGALVVGVPPGDGRAHLLADGDPGMERARAHRRHGRSRRVHRHACRDYRRRQPSPAPLVHVTVLSRRAEMAARPRGTVDPCCRLGVRVVARGRGTACRRGTLTPRDPAARLRHRRRRGLPRHRACHHPGGVPQLVEAPRGETRSPGRETGRNPLRP